MVSYVVRDRILVQAQGAPARTYTAGQTIFEPGATPVAHFDNASRTQPATYLLGVGDKELIQPLQ